MNVDQQLSEIHQSILETHHAVLSQSNAVERILLSVSPGFNGEKHSNEQRSLVQRRGNRDLHEASTNKTIPQSSRHDPFAKILPGFTEEHHQSSKYKPTLGESSSFAHMVPEPMVSPEPASPFEVSQNFFPETYTTDLQIAASSLLVTSFHEESSSDDFKPNCYRLFYFKSARQWRRLSISIDVCRSSIYWRATKISQFEYSTSDALYLTGAASIPCSLLAQIKMFLAEVEDLDEDAHFRLHLSSHNTIQEQHNKSELRSYVAANQMLEASRAILTFLDDLGCPRYFEKELTQIALLQPPNCFVTFVNGVLVRETKFARPLPSEEMLYNIQLLRCMNGIPGFAKLAGIVVDITGKHLKSYLVEFPKTRWNIIIDEIPQNLSISWERREKWARNLIEMVSLVHSKGFVVGTLSSLWRRFLVDDLDFLHFWTFKKRFFMGNVLGCYYPPEYLHFQNIPPSTYEAECPKITPKTDIYHLGLFLWRLAENLLPPQQLSPVCTREGCNIPLGSSCDPSHINPITLPRLRANIPQYYQDIINLCRAKDPNERPAAWRLLKLFPSRSDAESLETKASITQNLHTNILGNAFSNHCFCDHCRKRVRLSFFHCNTCQTGDYDICQVCFDKGLHCHDRDHWLVELKQTRGWIVAGKCYSCVQPSGQREIIDV